MLKSSIDYDPFELAIEEKIYRSLKRLGTIFAAGAVTLGVLDMTNIRSVDAAVEFLHDSSARIVELPDRVVALPDRIRSEIRNISLVPPALPQSLSTQATASVPQEQTAKLSQPLVLASARADDAALPTNAREAVSPVSKLIDLAPPSKSAASPVAELAAARHQDAIEMAMAPPQSAPQQTAMPQAAAAPAAAAPKPDLPASLAPSAETSKQDIAAALDQAPAQALTDAAPVKVAAAEPAAEAAPAPTPVSLPMSTPIPIGMVPLPRPAPGAPPPSPAERLHLEGKSYAKAERCLANAVYFEARSEPVRGQMAVAQVVLNRVFSGFYPKDVCSVIYQNADHYLGCQFTFACDGKRKLINERGAWARANRIAKETLDGLVYLPEVGKSTHYHAFYVHPVWVREMRRLARYGEHTFYRPIAWGNGADEPVWGSAAMVKKMAQNGRR